MVVCRSSEGWYRCRHYLMVMLAVIVSFTSPMAAADDFVVAINSRHTEKTIALSSKAFAAFFEATGTKHQFVVMSTPRMMRALRNGLVDMALYSDRNVAPDLVHSAQPFAVASLTLLHRKMPLRDVRLEMSNPRLHLAWSRGEGLEEIAGFKGRGVMVDSLDQGIRLIESGRVDGLLEWQSEVMSRLSQGELDAQGLMLTPLISGIEIYPIMLAASPKRAILDRFDAWLLESDRNGSLFELFRTAKYESAYPFKRPVDAE